MVKGCHPGHQAAPTNLRDTHETRENGSEIGVHVVKSESKHAADNIKQHLQIEESSQLPTSHPIRTSPLVTTILIEEWIINHPMSVL